MRGRLERGGEALAPRGSACVRPAPRRCAMARLPMEAAATSRAFRSGSPPASSVESVRVSWLVAYMRMRPPEVGHAQERSRSHDQGGALAAQPGHRTRGRAAQRPAGSRGRWPARRSRRPAGSGWAAAAWRPGPRRSSGTAGSRRRAGPWPGRTIITTRTMRVDGGRDRLLLQRLVEAQVLGEAPQHALEVAAALAGHEAGGEDRRIEVALGLEGLGERDAPTSPCRARWSSERRNTGSRWRSSMMSSDCTSGSPAFRSAASSWAKMRSEVGGDPRLAERRSRESPSPRRIGKR